MTAMLRTRQNLHTVLWTTLTVAEWDIELRKAIIRDFRPIMEIYRQL